MAPEINEAGGHPVAPANWTKVANGRQPLWFRPELQPGEGGRYEVQVQMTPSILLVEPEPEWCMRIGTVVAVEPTPQMIGYGARFVDESPLTDEASDGWTRHLFRPTIQEAAIALLIAVIQGG